MAKTNTIKLGMRIDPNVKEKLLQRKIHRRQSFSDVINELLNIADVFERRQEMSLNEQYSIKEDLCDKYDEREWVK